MRLPGALDGDGNHSDCDSPRQTYDSARNFLSGCVRTPEPDDPFARAADGDAKQSLRRMGSEMDQAAEMETSLFEASQDVRTLVRWLEVELKQRMIIIEEKVTQLAEPNEGEAKKQPPSKGRHNGRRSVIRHSGFLTPRPPRRDPTSGDDMGGHQQKSHMQANNSHRLVPPKAEPPRPPNEPPELDSMDAKPSIEAMEPQSSALGFAGRSGTPRLARQFSPDQPQPPTTRRASGGRRSAGGRPQSPTGSESEARADMLKLSSGGLLQMLEIHNRFSGRLVPGQFASSLWRFLEEPESSNAAGVYAQVMPIIILASVALTILQSGNPAPFTGIWPIITEIILDIFYLFEVSLRWAVSPRFWRFLLSGYNLVDLTAVFVVPLRLAILCVVQVDSGVDPKFDPATPDWARTVMAGLLCMTPALRLLKLLRRFEKFHLLYHAFELALEALPVVLFTGAMLMLTGSGFIYMFESKENIESLPRAMWLCLMTMTTVTYGDVYPKSTQGTMFTSCLIIASSLYMSMPLGIVGNAFNRVWEDRDRLLLMERTKKRLAQWGYTPRDITTFFQLFSTKGDGVLNFTDFERMIEEMQLGLSSKRVLQLFELFDDDGSGTIDPEEFVAILFPGAVYTMYKETNIMHHTS